MAPKAHAPEVCHGHGHWLHACQEPLGKQVHTQAAQGPVLGGDEVIEVLMVISSSVCNCKLGACLCSLLCQLSSPDAR
eukprot:7879478-Heterocapsa_arctica.AAC.1